MESATTRRLRLSLVQVMKLVVYCAVASACAAPMVRLWRIGFVNGGTFQGLVSVVLFEAVLVPLVWVGLSLLLVRRGASRDGLICALLLCSVSVALGIACWSLFAYTLPVYGNAFAWVALLLNAMVILTLIAAMLWLSPRLWHYLRAGGTSSEPRPSAKATGA
jgi:hypothetical protein